MDVAAPTPPLKRTRDVKTRATSRSLRHLARASLAGGLRLTGKADYPELKDMAPRARLERLGELSGEARLRAVAAIEEGYLDYDLKWLREAQKLARGHKALKEHLEDYPPPEDEEEDWRSRAIEELDEMVQAEKEGRAPVFPEPTPEELREREGDAPIWEAIKAARAENPLPPDATEDERVAEGLAELEELFRLRQEVKKWRLFPGRGNPPPLRAVSRGRSILPKPEPEIPAGKKLYGMEDAFPVKFTRRE